MTAFATRPFRTTALPFPELRMGWGLDAHWAALAREHGWRCGVIDAVAIRHRAAPAAAPTAARRPSAEARAVPRRPSLHQAPSMSSDTLRTHRAVRRWKVVVVAEFYPSRRDPVLGVWAHRQAVAARDVGAEVQVLVLHRLVPAACGRREGATHWRASSGGRIREPRAQTLDGLPVRYVLLPLPTPPARATRTGAHGQRPR